MKLYPVPMLKNATVAGQRSNNFKSDVTKTYQATLTGDSGTLDAVVKIQVSNDKVNWIDALIFTLQAIDPVLVATNGAYAPSITEWAFTSATIESISGTGAKVTVMGGSRYDDADN